MIKIITGAKGSGKSKKMINLANETSKLSKGVVVYIDDDNRNMFELDRALRFINLADYKVDSHKSFYGFICGMISSNYDIKEIFVDGVLSLSELNDEKVDELLDHLVYFSNKHDVDVFISLDSKYNVPEKLKDSVIVS